MGFFSVLQGPPSTIAPPTSADIQVAASRPIGYQNGTPVAVNQSSNGEPLMFSGSLQTVSELTRNPSSASPRGGRG